MKTILLIVITFVFLASCVTDKSGMLPSEAIAYKENQQLRTKKDLSYSKIVKNGTAFIGPYNPHLYSKKAVYFKIPKNSVLKISKIKGNGPFNVESGKSFYIVVNFKNNGVNHQGVISSSLSKTYSGTAGYDFYHAVNPEFFEVISE